MDTSLCMFVYVYSNVIDEKLSSSDFKDDEKKNTQKIVNFDVNGFGDRC